MRKGLLVLVALAALASAASAASGPARDRAGGFIGPYTGVATGSRDNFHHRDNGSTDPDPHVVSDATDASHGRFLSSSRTESGGVSGTGNGDYQSATWHLEGVNGDNGSFSCDIPIHTQAYSATITGYAAGGQLFLRFKLDD